MKPTTFTVFAEHLKRSSGLVITTDKSYLLESRLTPILRKESLASLDDLAVKLSSNRALAEAVTEAMTTNESFFFRDTRPFDLFRDSVLPRLLTARGATKRLRIWSAAASSGQEAYSLAMILKELGPKLAGWQVDIVGTDLSKDMIERAKAGIYTQFEVQRGLPITMLVKYFTQDGDRWQIKPELRQMVRFQTFNLLESLRSLGQFDVVFCRNVLIYFDPPTKGKVLAAISDQMPEDGALFLGGAETVLGISDAFAPVAGERGVYAPTKGGAVSRPAVTAPTMPASRVA